MKNKDKKIKYIILIGASVLCIYVPRKEYEYHPDYEILSDSDAYAKYPEGYVYIGNEDYLKSIEFKPNDVLVLDEREEKKNMKIINSYKITDKELQNDIICILDEYEKENPSCWERSVETMRDEWTAHNILYGLNIRKSSTTDVDFENQEENRYKVLNKILH